VQIAIKVVLNYIAPMSSMTTSVFVLDCAATNSMPTQSANNSMTGFNLTSAHRRRFGSRQSAPRKDREPPHDCREDPCEPRGN